MRRLTSGDDGYGRVCPTCAGPKWEQSLQCQPCWAEGKRAPDYWTIRTCPDCGGPKEWRSARCRSCADSARPAVRAGRPQPQNHPWRKPFAAAAAIVAALALTGTNVSAATTLWAPGKTVPARFNEWDAASRMPAPRGLVMFYMERCPGWEELDILGCASHGSIYITPRRRDQRFTYFHELGHVTDFRHLDDRERSTLTRLLRMRRLPWWGAEGTPVSEHHLIPAEAYADAYADCAIQGQSVAPTDREGRRVCRAIAKAVTS